MKKALFCLAIAASMLWGYNIGTLTPRVYTELHVMEEICDYSSTVQSGDWEEACGLAQDASGRTYSKVVKE